MTRAAAEYQKKFQGKGFFANNITFRRHLEPELQNFEYNELFTFSLLKGDEERLSFTKKNYLQRADETQVDLRDEEYGLRIEALRDEISAIVQNQELTIFSGEQIEILQAIANEDERNIKIHEFKAGLIFNSIILALENLVDCTRDHAGLDDWEKQLQKSVKEKSNIDFSNILTFTTAFYRALFYGVRSKNNSQKAELDRAAAYATTKKAADLQDCIGGDVSDLENIYLTNKFPGQLWNEIKPLLARELEPFCVPGVQRHLLSWLEYVASGYQSDDAELFSPSNCMAMENIRKVVGAIMFRGGNIAINFFAKQLFEIIQDAKNIAQSESQESIAQQEGGFAQNGTCFTIITNKLAGSPDEEMSAVDYSDIAQIIDIDASTAAGKEAAKNLAREYFTSKLAFPPQDTIEYFQKNPQIEDSINLIMHINSYMARNISVPIWLTNLACEIVGVKGPKDLTQIEQNQFEVRLTNGLKAMAAEINGILHTNLQLILIPSDNQIGEMAKKPLVRLWQLDPEIMHNPSDIEVRDSLLQNALDAGANLNLITALVEGFGLEYFTGEFSIKGLLFHPEQREIINFLRSKDIQQNYIEALVQAISVGDVNYLQLAPYSFVEPAHPEREIPMRDWHSHIHDEITWPTLVLVNKALDVGLKARLREGLDPSSLPYNDDDRKEFIKKMLQNRGHFLGPDEPEVTVLAMMLLGNSNQSKLLQWIGDNFTEEEVHDIFSAVVNKDLSSRQECVLIAEALAKEPSQRILGIMDRKFTQYESYEDCEAMSLLNSELACFFLEKPNKTAEFLRCAIKAADSGDLFCQQTLAECSLSGLKGVRRDYDNALRYLDMWLENEERDDYSEAQAWYKKGRLYSSEFPGIDKNLLLAKDCFEEGQNIVQGLNDDIPHPTYAEYIAIAQEKIDAITAELGRQSPSHAVARGHEETLSRSRTPSPTLP